MIGIPSRLEHPLDLNRELRRAREKEKQCRPMEDRVINTMTELSDADAKLNVLNRNSGNIASVLFNGNGEGENYVNALRQVPQTIKQAQRSGMCPVHQNWLATIQYPQYYKSKLMVFLWRISNI